MVPDQEYSVTEMLDVAPFEFFAWTDQKSASLLGLPPSMAEEGIDMELHWVTEDGDIATMKSGAMIKPTVSLPLIHTSYTQHSLIH